MILGISYAIGGLVVLTFASEQLIKGAVRLAVVMRIAPIIVGSVIVGFGTSAPEMVVSAIAAAEGNLDIGVGNVIGSNVANISLVLGLAAIVSAVPVQPAILRREVPLSVASVGVFAALLQGDFNRVEGVTLMLLLALSLVVILCSSSRQPSAALAGNQQIDECVGEKTPSGAAELIRTIVGLVLVAGSAWFVVEGAQRIAIELNLTGGLVGFTLVAIGTSAPEILTAVAATRRGEVELLIGNLLGSNMFNSFAVGGVIALVSPGPVLDANLSVWGAAMMVVVAAVSALMMFFDKRVSRADGLGLLAIWLFCVIVLAAS